jgi:hypothetical protein
MTPDDEERANDPAFQAVDEAGGGVAEGFEQAEAALIDRIADPNVPGAHPLRHEQVESAEALRATGEAGEADEAHSSEVPDSDR